MQYVLREDQNPVFKKIWALIQRDICSEGVHMHATACTHRQVVTCRQMAHFFGKGGAW